jgi:hypothetical protein
MLIVGFHVPQRAVGEGTFVGAHQEALEYGSVILECRRG